MAFIKVSGADNWAIMELQMSIIKRKIKIIVLSNGTIQKKKWNFSELMTKNKKKKN